MTKRLLLEGRDWSNDIKKVLVTFQYTHVINTLYKQKSLTGLTSSSIQSTMKCSCQFTCTFTNQYLFFFCFKLFSRKMSHSLSYKEDKCVSKTCPTSKNTKRGLIRNTTKDCNIQEYLITMNLKTKQPSGKFYETFWGQNFRLFSFTKQVCLFISYFSLIFKIL